MANEGIPQRVKYSVFISTAIEITRLKNLDEMELTLLNETHNTLNQ